MSARLHCIYKDDRIRTCQSHQSHQYGWNSNTKRCLHASLSAISAQMKAMQSDSRCKNWMKWKERRKRSNPRGERLPRRHVLQARGTYNNNPTGIYTVTIAYSCCCRQVMDSLLMKEAQLVNFYV